MTARTALTILRPGTSDHTDAVSGYNLAVRHLAPAVVPSSADEVAAAVALAWEEHRRVSVQATGHGNVGSAEDELLILTSRLDGVQIDVAARTARVDAGVRWGTLVDRCAEHGLVPLGMASEASVGVTGYTLGGGTGPFARAQGFAADHVVSIELVDEEGRFRTIDAEHDSDQFWALRGGRDGFGIVTSLTLELIEEHQVFSAQLSYGPERADGALAAYARWQTDVSDALSSVAQIVRFPGAPPMLAIQLTFAGPEPEGRAHLSRLADIAPPDQVEAGSATAADLLRSRAQPPALPSWSRSIVLDQLDEDVARVVSAVAGPAQEVPFLLVELRPLGGAASRPAQVPNAVGHRDAVALLNVVAVPDPAAFAAAEAVSGHLWTVLAPWTDGHTLLNFDPESRPTCWDVSTRTRLEAIRRG